MDWKDEYMIGKGNDQITMIVPTTVAKSSLYAVVRFQDDRPQCGRETVEVVCQCWLLDKRDENGRTLCYMPTGEHLLHPNKKLTARQYVKLLHSFSLPPVTNNFEFDRFPVIPEVQNVSYAEADKAANLLKKSGWVCDKGKIELNLLLTKQKSRKRNKKADDGPPRLHYCDCDSGQSTEEGEDFYSLPNPQAVCLISFYFINFTSIF